MALNLNKLFVRVQGTSVPVADVISQSAQTDNVKKIYFLEATNQIINNGIVYGVDPSTVSSITDLQELIGAEKISDTSAFGKSVIARLQALEAITVDTTDNSDDYVSITIDSSVPTLHVNVVAIDTATDGSTGLVDVMNAKRYIDTEVAEAKTEVVAGEGINVTSATGANGQTVYTIDSSLSLEYVGAVTEGTPKNAHIKLTDGNGNSFGEIDVNNIIGNGILKGSSYNATTGVLTLTFAEADGTDKDVTIDLGAMLDINDMSVAQASQKYLTVDLSGGENSQAVFTVNTIDVSTVTENTTALADAWQVKQYVDSKVSDKNVDAEGDTYVTATAADNKVSVSTNIGSFTATQGTAGTYGADGTQTTAPSHGNLVGEENKLADASVIAAEVKKYVDGEFAIEIARSNAYTDSSISALDADVSTKGINVSVGVTEVNGKITAVNVTEDYATITYDTTTNTWSNTNQTGLVKGSDMETMKSYVDDKVGDTEISAAGDGKYIDASVDLIDKKKINVAANTVNLGFNDPADASAQLTGTADKLVDAADVASKVTSFVNARIAEDIDALDSTVTLTDVSNYVQTVVAEDNGKLTSTGSSLTVTYGTMDGQTANNATGGIAKAEDVQDFVDTYDFWTTYTPNSNNG